MTWIRLAISCLTSLLLIITGCTIEKSEVVGEVVDVEHKHIGRNKHKHIVRYSYSFDGQKFKSDETYWFSWRGSYETGDSILVQIINSSPSKSKIIGRIEKTNSVKVIKINKKE